MIDNYPTRLAHAIAPIPRIEPTVWGTAADGPLHQGDLDGYSDAGHLVRHNTLSGNQIPEMDEELRAIAASLDVSDARIIRESDGSIRSIFQPHLISSAVKQISELDTVLPVAQQLLGGDVYIHQARINYMSAFTSTGFYWHSDFETWHAEDGMPTMRAVSCVIALTENYPHNGTLMTMTGTNRMFYPCVGATPPSNHATSLAGQTVGVPDRDTLTQAAARGINQFVGPAGTGFWFDCNTLHGSGSNITPFPRSNLFLVFNSVDNRLVEPFAAPAPRPEYLGARA
jgi:ectoine hydroxylase